MRLPQYSLREVIRTTTYSELSRAVRQSDGREVVLKRYVDGADSGTRIAQEFEMLRQLEGPGIPRALELVQVGSDSAVLVQEYLPGISIESWAQEGGVEPGALLEVALQIARVLERVHAAGLVHRDVHPGNILVEPGSLRTHVIDFGLAHPLGGAARDAARASRTVARALAYIAPEQTGRMNRGVDYRSDLYMLGATLYLALTGRPPFDLSDPLRLIHAHLARVPTPPVELRADLPIALSRLILHLLEKEPDERYQSAGGLAHDLEQCRERLRESGEIPADLALGTADAASRLRFGDRLYGRDAESEALLAAFERARSGSTELVLISGPPGMGKSALVARLRARVAETDAYLAVGKAEPSWRNVPYRSWTAVMNSWVDQVLVEREERLQFWRERLRVAMRDLAAVLFPIIPSLEYIIGEVSPVPELGGTQTRERLALCMQYFLSGVAASEHPLVVFLDDLQWADTASLQLLRTLLERGEGSHLLIVGAYRREDISDTGDLEGLLKRLPENSLRSVHLELGPLSEDEVSQMLGDVLSLEPAAADSLARYVLARTEARPLNIQQFIVYLRDHEFLRCRSGTWEWDETSIVQARVPDNAIAFLISKLQHVPAREGEILQLAACVGDEFELDALERLCARPRAEILAGLRDLVAAGLLAPSSRGFRFGHDRIREAVLSLLPEERRAALHREMAEHLLRCFTSEEREEQIFSVLDHVNHALSGLDEKQRIEAIQLNGQAARRALASGAASTAQSYLSIARSLLQDRDWSDQRELTFDVYIDSSESAFQAGELEEALRILEPIDQRQLSIEEFGRFACKQLQALSGQDSLDDGGRCVREALARVDVRWPLRPSPLRLLWLIYRVRWLLGRHGGESGLEPNKMPTFRRAGRIVEQSGAMLARTNVPFLVQSICWEQIWNLRRGYSMPPALGLGAYAAFIAKGVWGPREADRIARIAVQWKKYEVDPIRNARLDLLVHGVIQPFVQSRRDALPPLARLSDEFCELGDPEYAFYARVLMALLHAHAGEPLEQSLSALEETDLWRKRSGHETEDMLRVRDLMATLQEGDAEIGVPDLRERTAELEAYIQTRPRVNEPSMRIVWMLVLCVSGEFELAFAQSEMLWKRVFREEPYAYLADYTLYRGLAAAWLADRQRGLARRRLLRGADRCRKKLARWAEDGPDFGHMAELLSAELLWARGQTQLAIRSFRWSATRALEQRFVHHAALALDRLAERLQLEGRSLDASTARTQARDLYLRWGANARAAALEAREDEVRKEFG